jgi:ribulose-bisphosphate carboxylase large chain
MDVVAKYYVETDKPIKEAAGAIAAEQSTGTWTEVSTLKEGDPAHRLDARVLKAEGNNVVIEYPVELFEPGNIPQYLSVIAGNLFGLGAVKNVRLQDVEFPEKLLHAHKGPRYGITEARQILGVFDRPLVGTIIKPKVGLTPTQTAQVAYEAALGGLDLIKDDETLTDQRFCPMKERLSMVMNRLDRAEAITGQQAFYAVNVTAGAARIVERAQRMVEVGANMIMVDVLTAGFDALEELAHTIDVPIHVHRTMHGAITRNRRHGISMLVISKLVRIAGGTNLHTGSYKGKMDSDAAENDQNRDALKKEWFGLKRVFPVASGGLSPLNVAPNVVGYGVDCIVQAGGGVHGHPGGTAAGAKAMRQAVDAAVEGVSIEEYSRNHPELRSAMEKWG